MEYDLHNVVQMKKKHACGTNRWEIIRLGMDIKMKCLGCRHIVMLKRQEFEQKLKKVIAEMPDENER